MRFSSFFVQGLSRKLLMIHLPLTVVAVLAVFAVLEVDYYHKEHARLIETLARVVNVQGVAVESAVWEFDLAHIRDLLEKQTHLPFLQSAIVHGSGGEILASVGDVLKPPQSPDFRMERQLLHQSGSKSRVIGKLVITIHDDGIRQALMGHLKVNGSILLALMLILIVGTLYGVRVVIGRPLEEFRNAIERPMEEQIRSPLKWKRSDELGDVLHAYNGMLEGRHTAEIAMRQREEDLRQAVRQAQEAGADAARFNRLATGREIRMLELKVLVNQLSVQLDRSPPFATPHAKDDAISTGESPPLPCNETECSTLPGTLSPPSKGENPNSSAPPGPRLGEELSLEAILEMADMNPMFDAFCTAVGIPAAIIDLNAKVLAASRWQRACTDFHRTNSVTCARCIESDMDLSRSLQAGEEYALYRCKNGLTDAASPIVVNGRHLANMFVGQFLLEAPDWDFFRTQARDVGFDEEAYLAALSEVPVIDEERLPSILGFLTRFAKLTATMCMERLQAKKSETDMRQGRQAAMNLAEDAERARGELADYQKHLESLVEERTTELRSAEERSRLILDCVGEGIFGTDAGGQVHFINPSALKMLSLTLEEVIGHSLHPLSHHSYPDGSPYPIEACPMWRAFTYGDTSHVDDEYMWRKGGDGFPVEYSALPIRREGAVVGSVVTFKDITERRRTESRLRFTGHVVENAAEAIYWINIDNDRIVYANTAGRHLLGYNQETLVGVHINEIDVELTSERFARLIGEIASGESLTRESRFLARNRQSIDVELTLFLAEFEENSHVVVSAKDITKRHQAEAQIREKMAELEKFTSVAVGRELRMIALKEEINALNIELGREQPYKIVE